MPAKGVIRVEIDGRPPTMEALQRLAVDYGGHFTAMQVRDARAASRGTWPVSTRAPGSQRTLAHVKHIGGFGQGHHARMARRAGFDDALFTGHDGAVSETSIANIGFLLGDELVWPSAPALQGITMQLLEPGLATAGIPIATS